MIEMISTYIHDFGLVAFGFILAFALMLEHQNKDVDSWIDADWENEQENDLR